jgi:hypothetical protein
MAVPCLHKHTDMVCEAFKDEPWTLWHGYGIILDVLVCECILMTLTDYLNPLAVRYSISTCQFLRAPIA